MGDTKPETKRARILPTMDKVSVSRKAWATANPEKVRASRRKWEANNPDRHKRWPECWHRHIKNRYGITETDFNAMLVRQHGGCAICNDGPGKRKFHVDHCHSTGKIRGLLCHRCNVGIGMFRENPQLFIEAITYMMEVR
jgi:hypothetical protein